MKRLRGRGDRVRDRIIKRGNREEGGGGGGRGVRRGRRKEDQG
jgi:hypothetical protein